MAAAATAAPASAAGAWRAARSSSASLVALLVGGGVGRPRWSADDDRGRRCGPPRARRPRLHHRVVDHDDHRASAAASGTHRLRRRRPHPLGRVGGRRHRRRLRLLADAGADPTAALRRRPGDLPPRGHPRPARGRPVELPTVPGADGAGDGPGRGRLRRLLGGVEPRARLRGAGGGGDARRARRGRSGPRRHGTVAGGGPPPGASTTSTASRVAQLSYAYGFNGFVRPRRQGVARRPDRPGADPGRRAGRPSGRRRARRRVAPLGQRVPPRGRRGAAGGGGRAGRRCRARSTWSSATTPTSCSRSRRSATVGGVGHGQPAVEQLAAVLPG